MTRFGGRALVIGLFLATIFVSVFPATAQGGVTVQAGYNLALRSQPNRNAAQLGTVPFDTELLATAISSDRNWVAVTYNGQGGWIALQYAAVLEGSLGDLPVSDQTFSAVGGTGPVTGEVVVITTINLRYRANPTLDERPLGAIPNQTAVPALALSADGQFVLVSYLGQNVWVYRQYVQEVSGSLEGFTPGAPPSGVAAGELMVDSAVTGTINDAAWYVDYTIALEADQVITVSLQKGDDVFLDTYLYIYGPDGALIAYDDDGGLGLNSLIANFVAPESGLYTIRASRYGGANGASSGDYRLSVVEPFVSLEPFGIFVAVDGTTDRHDWHYALPNDLRAVRFASARLIAYVREEARVLESCDYQLETTGEVVTVDRVRVDYLIRLVDAASGNQLEERSFGRDPEPCPASFIQDLQLEARPQIWEASSWFRERLGG